METLQKYYLTFNLVLIIHEQLAHCSLRDVSLIWVHLRWQLTNTLTSVRFQFTRCVHCTYGALQMFIVRTVHFRCSLYVRCTSDVHCGARDTLKEFPSPSTCSSVRWAPGQLAVVVDGSLINLHRYMKSPRSVCTGSCAVLTAVCPHYRA